MNLPAVLTRSFAFLLAFATGAVLYADELEFSAGRVRSVFAEGKEQTVLEDSAVVENSEIYISASSIMLSGEDNRYIRSRGNVFLRDKENDSELHSQVLSYDSVEESLVLEGNAEYRDREEDILVRSTFIEKRDQLVVFQLNVQIIREDLIARAEYVRYFRDQKKIELSGFPVVYYKEDEYRASVIAIFTETDEIILEGEVQGKISDDSGDDEGAQETAEDRQ